MKLENLEEEKQRLERKEKELKAKINYLENHININDIKEATGWLRAYQLRSVDLAYKIQNIVEQLNLKVFLDADTLLGATLRNGFIPWKDTFKIAILRQDFEKLIIFCQKELIFSNLPYKKLEKDNYFSHIEFLINSNPNEIISILTPYTLHFYVGKNFKDIANVEFNVYDYFPDNFSVSDMQDYKVCLKNKLKMLFTYNDVFDLYKSELREMTCEYSNQIAPGIGSWALLNNPFRGYINYNRIFPLKKINFEGKHFNIPNKEDIINSLYYEFPLSFPSKYKFYTVSKIENYLRLTGKRSLYETEKGNDNDFF